MWTCPKCDRIFTKDNQPHSCQRIPIDQHFKNKPQAKILFDFLVKQINHQIGQTKTISLPCCLHLFGSHDFLAALPKKDRLEIRFSLDYVLPGPRLKIAVPVSSKFYKNCLDIYSQKEIDQELIGWLKRSYCLKD